MNRRVARFTIPCLLTALLLAGQLIPPARAQQTSLPPGVVALVAVTEDNAAHLLVLDLATGRVGQVDAAILPETNLAWQPGGTALAFPNADGGYGLLRTLRGCFDADGLCTDLIEVYPPFLVQQLAWSVDGTQLYFRSDDGLKLAPPRARPAQNTALELDCALGFAVAGTAPHLLCLAPDPLGNAQIQIFRIDGDLFTLLSTVGTFPQITAYAIAPDGSAVVGTLETAGDSGFFAPAEGAAIRLANYQIHVYAAAFRPGGTQIALAGASSDSTGDGSLRDGDPAELFLYDTATAALTQIPGFTGATALTWSPDGQHVLAVTAASALSLYTPGTNLVSAVPAQFPQPDLTVLLLAWSASEAPLPLIPTLPAVATSTPIPTLTPAPTLTPFTFPTLTPMPTLTPFIPPTLTPFPSATPGSPMGTNCEFAFVGGGGLPVAIGDTAEVTPYGAAVRLRNAPALTATLLRELLPGTRMAILDGPVCSQGYRWWQVRLEVGAVVGYLADSDRSGLWITAVLPVPPTPGESMSFYADRYTINAGECVTVRWDVEGIKEVYYQNVGVTGHESRQECPASSKTYTLRVIRLDNSEVLQQVTIFVLAP